jgi:hypothetical protein
MLETHVLQESRTKILSLSNEQVTELSRLSSQLAGTSSWWGSNDLETDRDRGVIRVEPRGNSQFAITILDAVGAIGLPGMTIIVEPKIPLDHFSYIATAAMTTRFREDPSELGLAGGQHFGELVSTWFLAHQERILRRGLAPGYRPTQETTPAARGRILALPTAQRWFRGDSRVDCSYDSFDLDTPANRLLKAATTRLARSAVLDDGIRARACRALRFMSEVGEIQNGDDKVALSRDISHYKRAIFFAKQIMTSAGRDLSEGDVTSHSFLYKTPDLMEAGIRELLASALSPIRIEKHGRVLKPSTVAVHPDLEIGPPPFTGDVKYKLSGGTWNRSDLAQSVFFATAYDSPRALIISFSADPIASLASLKVGRVEVESVIWSVQPGTTPARAAERLISQVRAFAVSPTF